VTLDVIGDTSTTPSDALTLNLRELKIEAGDPSYNQIARRIQANRQLEGYDLAAARVAQSSVYDLFKLGRKRKNATLVGEVVFALTGDKELANQYSEHCQRGTSLFPLANNPSKTAADLVPKMASNTVPAVSLEASPAPEPTAPEPPLNFESEQLEITAQDEAPRKATKTKSAILGKSLSFRTQILIGFVAVALNIILGTLRYEFLHGYAPLWLDMVGTALAAFTLGPWAAVAVGASSHLLIGLTGQWFGQFWFILVNIVGALIWGYGYRWARDGGQKFGLRFLYITLLVSLSCSLVAFNIIEIVLAGDLYHPAGTLLYYALETPGHSTASLRFQINLLMSVIDKTFSSILALVIASKLQQHLGLGNSGFFSNRTARY